MAKLFILYFIGCFFYAGVYAQVVDSSLVKIQKIQAKYIDGIDRKVNCYNDHVTTAMLKTFSRLSRWENKIKAILQKTNPAAAESLFGNNQPSFNSLLGKLRQGEAMILPYQSAYNLYQDELHTGLLYLESQRELLDSGFAERITLTNDKVNQQVGVEEQAEALRQFIKERKKQLTEQALQYIGNSRYLQKMNKEAYYYSATLTNYKDLFSNKGKAEETVRNILERIPAFKQFMQKNGKLAELFEQPVEAANMTNNALLQTRASIQELLQTKITGGTTNTIHQVQQGVKEAKDQLNLLKEKIKDKEIVYTADETDTTDFKPNPQKTKTFRQRLDYSFNIQYINGTQLVRASSDIALTIGYKINDRLLIGAGMAYKLGIGSIRHIHFTHEGVGLLGFIDWKLKGKIFISGGYELNHNTSFRYIEALGKPTAWKKSALVGLTKKVAVKTMFFKGASVQLLYDFLYHQHLPASKPLLFRIGYNF